MSTMEATMSMLEVMPEDARIKVYEYTQQLFASKKPANPFEIVDEEKVLLNLAQSREQIAAGEGLDMGAALNEMGKRHGFV